jgi:UDP-galactose transporter B1
MHGGREHDKRYAHTSVTRDILDVVLCSGGIYFCYILYGILQERIYNVGDKAKGDRFSYSMFLVFVQCIANGLLGLLLWAVRPQPKVKESKGLQYEFFKISFAYIGAMFASNYSLNFVTYPTQALAKSCKLIPVMIMNVFVNSKRYTFREYLNVFFITAGISVFMLMKTTHKKGHAVEEAAGESWIGLLFLFFSLLLDGFTGPNQERVMAKHGPSEAQLMTFMNFYAVIIVFVAMFVTDGFFPAIAFCTRYPEVVWEIASFSILSALGQTVIMYTLFRFNSLVLTTITTTRKFFTILGSVIVFGHVLNEYQMLGVFLVFLGLSLDIVEKYQEKQKRRARAARAE